MESKLLFIYDGQCPFCNQFAELLELKANLPNIQVKNARNHPFEIPKNYDMDLKGAILIKDGEMLYGAEAINCITSQIKNPSDSLLKLLVLIFTSRNRANFLFPALLIARRIALLIKGVPIKIIN